MVPGTEGERIWGTRSCRTLRTARTPQQGGRSRGLEGEARTQGPREGHAKGRGPGRKRASSQHLRGVRGAPTVQQELPPPRPVPSGCAACV